MGTNVVLFGGKKLSLDQLLTATRVTLKPEGRSVLSIMKGWASIIKGLHLTVGTAQVPEFLSVVDGSYYWR